MSYADAAILEARPITEEVLTPQQFTKLSKQEKAAIKEVKIIAPKLGSKGFGGVKVVYKNVIYKAG